MAAPKPLLSEPPPSFSPVEGGAIVQFGRYEIIGELAAGGMGVVYLARHAGEAGFQRLFALKLMHDHLARETEFVEMLLDEARIASRLHHPNVVPIVDLGQHEGRYFLVMDYIEGCSLSQLCRRNRKERPPRLTIPLIIDVLEGLHAAHTLVGDDDEPLNLVHRDVSSQNVMVGVDGIARLIDFGIAKAEARISSTRPGVLKGKLAFMSPEQLKEGAAIDARSDVFSVGAMMWSMLTGARLFKGDSESVTITNVLTKRVPPPSKCGLKPPECFDAICLRALERDPDARYQSAAEMLTDLRKAAIESDRLGPRDEIAHWVKRSFQKEFTARRGAIRDRSSLSDVTMSLERVEDLATIPSLGSLSSSNAAHGGGGTPHSDGSLSIVIPRRRLRLITASVAVALFGGAIWMWSSRDRPAANAQSEVSRSTSSTPAASEEPDRRDTEGEEQASAPGAAEAHHAAAEDEPAAPAQSASDPKPALRRRARRARVEPAATAQAEPAAAKTSQPSEAPPAPPPQPPSLEKNPYLH